MKAMRKDLDQRIKPEKDTTWQAQLAERDALDAQTTAAVDHALQNVKDGKLKSLVQTNLI